MDRWVGKVAIITGTSKGIGAATAELLLDIGVHVVGLGRTEDRLLEVAKKFQGKKGKFYPMKADISNEQDLLNVFEQTKKNVGTVHILINNAGAYREKGLIDGATEAWRDTFDTNILALCVATREAIKDMRENNVDGHVIHIGSVMPNGRLPNVNVYPASKAAVHALTETLRQELNSIKSKIKVSCINPGTVRTGAAEPNTDSTDNQELQDHYKTAPLLEPIDIANAVIYALSTPPHVQVHEMTIRPIGEYV